MFALGSKLMGHYSMVISIVLCFCSLKHARAVFRCLFNFLLMYVFLKSIIAFDSCSSVGSFLLYMTLHK